MNNIEPHAMTLNEYMHKSRRTMGDLDLKEWRINAALGLAGEAGEVVDIIKKWAYHGHELDVDAVIDELGDVSFYVAAMCTACGISLEAVARHNVAKLQRRYPDGFSVERSVGREE